MSNRQKDGYFQCTTCNKKCFTKIAFEKHLINEHSLILQIEKDKVVNKDSISHQDCIPHISRDKTSNTSDTMETPSKNSKENNHSTNQTIAAKVKLEVMDPIAQQDCNPHISSDQTSNTSGTLDTPSKNSKGNYLHIATNPAFAAKLTLIVLMLYHF